MAITKAQKEINLTELRSLISTSKTIVVWEYLGLNANEQSDLRIKLKDANGLNKVFKNRLAKIAFKEANKEEINEVLTGSSSFLFIGDDESTALKELHKIIIKHDNLNFKGGYVDGKFYDGAKILELAGLPSKNDLVSMLLSVLQGTIRNLAYSLSQVAANKQEEPAAKENIEIAEDVKEAGKEGTVEVEVKETPTEIKKEAEVEKTSAKEE